MEIKGVSDSQQGYQPIRLRMRCPSCLREGTFDARGQDLILGGVEGSNWITAERLCPNPDCRAHIFVVYDSRSDTVVVSYPPERFDFDASGLPGTVKEPLEEAIECHSHQSFKAAALMVRRTLEAVCDDREANGPNLKNRIEALGGQVVLPPRMIEGLQNLRLLGNDAAHVEARDYLEIGKRELEIALEVTKLILTATYQTAKALDDLEALRSGEPEAPA